MNIEIRKSGIFWEVIRDGYLFCYCTDEKLAEEIKEDLEEIERSLDGERCENHDT